MELDKKMLEQSSVLTKENSNDEVLLMTERRLLGTLLKTLPNYPKKTDENSQLTYRQIAELILTNLELEDFNNNFHQILFVTIKKNYDPNNKILGLDTIVASLPKYIQQSGLDLNNWVIAILSRGNLCTYEAILECIKILKQHSALKKIDCLLKKFIQNAYDQGIIQNNLVDFQNKLNEIINCEISGQQMNPEYWLIATRIDEFKEKIQLYISKMYRQTIQTSCREINNLIGGWKKKGLIIIGARPGIGKTTFAINLALRAQYSMEDNEIVVFFSLEMDTDEILSRIMSLCLDKNFTLNKENDHVWNEEEKQNINEVLARIKTFKLAVIDQTDLSIGQIKKHLEKIKASGRNIKLVIVDYLQLVSSSFSDLNSTLNMNRYLEISAVSKGLKNIAREWDIPVIACSQLKRNNDKEVKKIPQLSDLKDSGNIEQDADIVSVLYNDEFSPDHNVVIWDILKNRQGNIGKIRFYFTKEKSLFETEQEFRFATKWNLRIQR